MLDEIIKSLGVGETHTDEQRNLVRQIINKDMSTSLTYQEWEFLYELHKTLHPIVYKLNDRGRLTQWEWDMLRMNGCTRKSLKRKLKPLDYIGFSIRSSASLKKSTATVYLINLVNLLMGLQEYLSSPRKAVHL